jgi:pyruvate/2-oxoglutarate dehydrogenase complex dihydrolipoamide acyltransferase (E2) component
MSEFPINIPRVSVAISEATLLEKLVDDGQRVQEGEPLFLMETEKVETEIPAGASGTVRWAGEVETTYPIGTRIGTIEQD